MNNPTMKQNKITIFMNVLVLTALMFFLIWVNNSAQAKRSIPSTGRPNIVRLKTQQDIYNTYKLNDLWGVKVLHLNRFLNMADYAPREEVRSSPYPIKTGDIRPLYEKGLDSHNWLYIASISGMVRSVTTVLPGEIFMERSEAFKSDSFFSVRGKTIKGYSYDVPLRIVTLDDLPAINEPVVVNVDAGYFSSKTDPLMVARMVKEKCPDIRMIILIDSIDEADITSIMRGDLSRFVSAWSDI